MLRACPRSLVATGGPRRKFRNVVTAPQFVCIIVMGVRSVDEGDPMLECWRGAGRAQAPGRAAITAVALVLMAATALEPSAAVGQAARGAPGTLDRSFGTGGVVLTDDAGSHDVARDVLVLPDGRIVTAGFWGRTVDGRTTNDLGLARY